MRDVDPDVVFFLFEVSFVDPVDVFFLLEGSFAITIERGADVICSSVDEAGI